MGRRGHLRVLKLNEGFSKDPDHELLYFELTYRSKSTVYFHPGEHPLEPSTHRFQLLYSLHS